MTAVRDPISAIGRKAPAFTPEQNDIIATWAEAMRGHGLRTELHTGLFADLEQSMLVSPWTGDAPSWLVHRTPDGAVAVRMWPGPTLARNSSGGMPSRMHN